LKELSKLKSKGSSNITQGSVVNKAMDKLHIWHKNLWNQQRLL